MQRIVDALVAGDHAAALAAAQALLDEGYAPSRIVTEGLQAAMARLDEKCTIEDFNLLEIMLVGRAVSAVVARLYPDREPPQGGLATFVIATLEGDVHDLGKSILRMVLVGRGYRVVDCGKDCPVAVLVESAERERAEAVLVSGLITSVIPQVRLVRPALRARGLGHLPIIAGGAALRQCSPRQLGVDHVAEDAFAGARYLDGLFRHAAEATP